MTARVLRSMARRPSRCVTYATPSCRLAVMLRGTTSPRSANTLSVVAPVRRTSTRCCNASSSSTPAEVITTSVGMTGARVAGTAKLAIGRPEMSCTRCNVAPRPSASALATQRLPLVVSISSAVTSRNPATSARVRSMEWSLPSATTRSLRPARSPNTNRFETASHVRPPGEKSPLVKCPASSTATGDIGGGGARGATGATGLSRLRSPDSLRAEADARGARGARGAGATEGLATPARSDSTAGQSGNSRMRANSSALTSTMAPLSARRRIITSASSGRLLRTCVRASRNINARSLRGPCWTVRHARSCARSKSSCAMADSVSARHPGTPVHAAAWRAAAGAVAPHVSARQHAMNQCPLWGGTFTRRSRPASASTLQFLIPRGAARVAPPCP